MTETRGRKTLKIVGGVLGVILIVFVVAVILTPVRKRGRRVIAAPDRVEMNRPQAGSNLPANQPEGEAAEVEELSFQEFLDGMERKVPKDVAEKLSRAFMSDPALRAAWKRFKGRRGGKAPARDLVDLLTRMPEFRKFVKRFANDPATRQALGALLKDPRFEDTLRAEPGQGAQTNDPLDLQREWEALAMSGVGDVDPTELVGSARMAGISTGLSKRMGASAAGGSDRMSGMGADGMGGGRAPGGGSGPKDVASGLSAHNVDPTLNKLFKTRTVGDADTTDSQRYRDDARKWISKFLAALRPDSARRAIQGELESGREDQWGACFITNNFQLCRNVCNEVPEARCENKTPYWACRGANPGKADTRPALECVRRCLQGRPMQCEPDAGEWTSLCAPGNILDKSECKNSMKWGPCHPNPSPPGGCTQLYGDIGGRLDPEIVGGTPVAVVPSPSPSPTASPAPAAPTAPDDRNAALLAQIEAERRRAAALRAAEAEAAAAAAALRTAEAAAAAAALRTAEEEAAAAREREAAAAAAAAAEAAALALKSGSPEPPPPPGWWENAGGWVGKNLGSLFGEGTGKAWGDAGKKAGKWVDEKLDAAKKKLEKCKPRWGLPPWSC